MRLSIWTAALLIAGAGWAESSSSVSTEIDSLDGLREDLEEQLTQVDAALDSLRKVQEEQADPPVTTAVVVTDEIGEEIDITERQKYGLFPGVADFVSAAYFRRPDGTYFIRLHTAGGSGGKDIEKVNNVSLAGIEFVRATIKGHVAGT